MWRLVTLRSRGRGDERGVTAVVVALSLVVLLGFTALSVDLGALWSDKKQLQNGADAGALAIAQACASGDCGATAATAQAFAEQNKIDGNAFAKSVDVKGSQVTVITESTRTHWFAQVLLGRETTVRTATATATWKTLGGISTIPLTFSLCAFYAQNEFPYGAPVNGDIVTLRIIKSSDKGGNYAVPSDVTCKLAPKPDPAHNEVAGGFGWVNVDTKGTCKATIDADGLLYSDTGMDGPDCSLKAADLQDKTVLIPIFDSWSVKGGKNASYHVATFAAFKITGYCLKLGGGPSGWKITCSGASDSRIVGKFVSWVSLEEAASIGGTWPDMGVRVVELIK